jgi:hypothetical protein
MAQEDKQHRRSCASGKGKGRGHCGGRAGVTGMAHAALSHVHDALPSSSATSYRRRLPCVSRGRGGGHRGRCGAPPHGHDDRPRDANRGHVFAGSKGARAAALRGGRRGGSHALSREARSRVSVFTCEVPPSTVHSRDRAAQCRCFRTLRTAPAPVRSPRPLCRGCPLLELVNAPSPKTPSPLQSKMRTSRWWVSDKVP